MIGLEFNFLENNKTKVEIALVFEIVFQCCVFLNKLAIVEFNLRQHTV